MLAIFLSLGCVSSPTELIHDPSQLVLREDGTLALASSGTDGVGILIWEVDPHSGELTRDEDVFGEEPLDWAAEVQEWNPTGEFDAPSMPEEGVLYYTVFDEGEDGVQDVIGRATWDGDAWADDPWCDSGDDERFTHVASSGEVAEENTIEAPYIFAHDDWYYLLVNWGACCRGVDSTYEIRMGRSEHPEGPFHDVDGMDLADGGGSAFLASQGDHTGPGHAGIIALEDDGSESFLLSYHYYDASDDGTAKLGLRSLTWENGWPVAGAVLEP